MSLEEVPERTTRFLENIHELAAGSYTEEERTLLAPLLPTGPEIEMPLRLLDLLEEHRPLMRQVIGDDLSGFVSTISNTLGFVERRTASEGHPPIQGDELHYAIQKISLLIKIVMLKELGFKNERIATFIERNPYFIHMKFV